jgi:DNA polymerase-3 subunit gamma/tau
LEKKSAIYKVFARKYRPRKFEDLIGQEYLVKTLQNAFKYDKLAHAFLLTGIRGVGKTTTARIIASTINCLNLQKNSSQENIENNYEPCLVCDSCVAALKDNHPDIIEIDAASKTGVDDIRELIENANYTPVMGKYRIYIIDEVHMLSNSAFNALLKTLEEPPEHTKFIFATTEIRKIPLTILSRCQKFSLKRVTNQELAKLLAQICQKEQILADQHALEVICNHAGGSVRDALSILDQIRLVTQDKLTQDIVRNILGYCDLENSFSLFESLITGDVEQLVINFNNIYETGIEVKNILNDLLEITYLVSKAIILKDNFTEMKVSSEIEQRIKSFSQQLNITHTSRIWQMLLKAINEINLSVNQRQALEMVLIRCCYLATNYNLTKIVNKLSDEIKKKV